GFNLQSQKAPNVMLFLLKMTEKRDLLIKKLISALTTLKNAHSNFVKFYVQDVLVAAFQTGIAKIDFKDDERRIIGSLIKDVIKKIDEFIFEVGYSFEHNEASNCMVFRSGLQFMFDNFKSFPVSQSETLEDTFKYFNNTESIETLDEALHKWKENTDSLAFDDIIFDKEDITRPNDVPSSHIWWC
ncbi:unnamed protein product, partial [Brachionus calyciflorus]